MVPQIHIVKSQYCQIKFDYCRIEVNVCFTDVRVRRGGGIKYDKYSVEYRKLKYLGNCLTTSISMKTIKTENRKYDLSVQYQKLFFNHLSL